MAKARPITADPLAYAASPQTRGAPDLALHEGWPAWKVSVFVIAFCGAFWGGVIWLGASLFS